MRLSPDEGVLALHELLATIDTSPAHAGEVWLSIF
jgi:hypothetical protein